MKQKKKDLHLYNKYLPFLAIMSHRMPISNLSYRIWSVPFDWSIGQIYVNSVDIIDASLMAFINDFNEPL